MAVYSFELIVNSEPSTAVTFTPSAAITGSAAPFNATGVVASGTVLGTFAVAPTGWQGILALSGADAGKFVLNTYQFAVGANPLAVGGGSGTNGEYDVTITATP